MDPESKENIEAAFEHFAHDTFATEATGIELIEKSDGFARAGFDVADVHRNAMGNVMGGSLYTLADFTASAANFIKGSPSVTIDGSIRYLTAARGSKITATARAERKGRTMSFYQVSIEDDLGTAIATANLTFYRMPQTR